MDNNSSDERQHFILEGARKRKRKSSLTGRREKKQKKLNRAIQENRQNEIESRRLKRLNPEYLQRERQKDNLTRASRLSNPEYRKQERQAENERRATRRSDPEYRQRERQNDNLTRASRLSNPENRQQERQAENERRATRRSDPEYRQCERQKDNLARASRLSNPEYRQKKRQAENERRTTKRSDPEFRKQELQRDNSTRVARRSDAHYSRNESNRDNTVRNLWIKAVEKYEKNIKDGPFNRCFSCDRLLFKKQVRNTNREKLHEKGCTEDFIKKILLEEHHLSQELQFCSTCFTYIKKQQFPRFNINNSNLKFVDIPTEFKELKLSSLEERCVAARIPFMKLVSLGCDQQLGIKSGIVNVPVDVRKTIQSIPAGPEDSGVIELSLKRRMCYKSSYLKELVRPGSMWKAAKLLCETPLYIQEGIQLNHQFEVNDVDADGQSVQNPQINGDVSANDFVDRVSEENSGEEESEYIQEETLLDSNEAIQFAPGEGEIPIPMFLDPYCEELSFPNIYFGHPRNSQPAGIRLSYDDIISSELQRYDRRACRPDHLLFCHKKSQIQQLMKQINIVFRKSPQNNNINASQATNNDFIQNEIHHDNAYRFMTSITGSPAYWQSQKRKVLAMIRQLGIFTLFVTLSAAETHWSELLVILKRTVDKEELSESDAIHLQFQEKARLIRCDPITCAQYFNHRFRELRKTWKVNDGPFGSYKIINHFFRIEFQHRGSPHVHLVLWVQNAPIYNSENPQSVAAVTQFIDMVSTTETDDPDIEDLVKYQYHKCTKTCKRTVAGKTFCRFNAPFTPMDETRILEPIDEELSKDQKKHFSDINTRLKDLLDTENDSIGSFQNLLEKLECTFDDYIMAARMNLKHSKVFIKREPKNCRTNPYNKKILKLMRSNMDIQFVLHPYACVGYVVDYINKSSRGLSKLLRDCIEDANRGNYSIKEKLKSLAHILYNSSEISAQEAAWCRCRLSMAECSVMVEFINSGPISTRQRILKSNLELKKLVETDPSSTDIYQKGPIDHYSQRPDDLENICLAEFVAQYTFKKTNTQTNMQNEIIDPELEPDEVSQETDDEFDENENLIQCAEGSNQRKFSLKDGSGIIVKRTKSKVIRYCRFSIEEDQNNFFREMCLLFLPWRNESVEIENVNCSETYKRNEKVIRENYQKYNAIDLNLNDIITDIEEERNEIDEEHAEDNEEANMNSDQVDAANTFTNVYQFDDNVVQPDFSAEIGDSSFAISEGISKYVVPDLLNTENYFNLCNSLNLEQKDYLLHLISELKTNIKTPFYHFISGGAGVGKSHLIRGIYQSAARVFRKNQGLVNDNEILLLSYTGMAAHNIGGMTAHSALHLTTTKGDSLSPLKPDKLNTVRSKLWHLKLIIIDEISMLSSELLNQISARLKQIFLTNREFGGKSVIVVGDFLQLKPVGGTMAFVSKQKNNNSTSCLTENPQWQLFQYYKLTQIMRQRDDLRFAEALNHIASGTTTSEDNQLILSRCFEKAQNLPEIAKTITRLMATNNQVDSYNSLRVRQKEAEGAESKPSPAEDKFSGQLKTSQKNQALHILKKLDKKDTQNLPTTLQLVVGCRYMISTNIDVTDGLFNGATGVLRRIEVFNGKISAIYIEFDDKKIGQKARSQRASLMTVNKISNAWTPILKCRKTFNVLKKGCVQVTREQFPVLIAEGITVHKSQGQSFQNVVVDLGTRAMERSMLYVALSRATTLSGLYIIGKFKAPSSPAADDKIIMELNRLSEYCTLIPKFSNFGITDPSFMQIISHNVQSIRNHLKSVTSDKVYTNSDFILLQETWSLDNETYPIENFSEICRNTYSGRRPKAQGTLIFSKICLKNFITGTGETRKILQKQHIEITFCTVLFGSNNFLIINVYKNPEVKFDMFKEALQELNQEIKSHQNVILTGDLNMDFSKPMNEIELLLDRDYSMKLISERKSTTDYNTVIDVIFAKFSPNVLYKTFTYESYFSHHKPLLLRIYKN